MVDRLRATPRSETEIARGRIELPARDRRDPPSYEIGLATADPGSGSARGVPGPSTRDGELTRGHVADPSGYSRSLLRGGVVGSAADSCVQARRGVAITTSNRGVGSGGHVSLAASDGAPIARGDVGDFGSVEGVEAASPTDRRAITKSVVAAPPGDRRVISARLVQLAAPDKSRETGGLVLRSPSDSGVLSRKRC